MKTPSTFIFVIFKHYMSLFYCIQVLAVLFTGFVTQHFLWSSAVFLCLQETREVEVMDGRLAELVG